MKVVEKNNNKFDYSKYLKMSVKALNNLPKDIKKKLQISDDFLVDYANTKSLSMAMTFACKDKLNERELIIRFINIDPATAINKAGNIVKKDVKIVALAFEVANKRNVKSPKVPKELQENLEFLVKIVKENPANIHLLTPKQKKDENIMIEMLKAEPNAKEIKEVIASTVSEMPAEKSADFMNKAVEISPETVTAIPSKDVEVIKEVVENNPEAEEHLTDEQKEALENHESEQIEEVTVEDEPAKFSDKKIIDPEENLKNILDLNLKKNPVQKTLDDVEMIK